MHYLTIGLNDFLENENNNIEDQPILSPLLNYC